MMPTRALDNVPLALLVGALVVALALLLWGRGRREGLADDVRGDVANKCRLGMSLNDIARKDPAIKELMKDDDEKQELKKACQEGRKAFTSEKRSDKYSEEKCKQVVVDGANLSGKKCKTVGLKQQMPCAHKKGRCCDIYSNCMDYSDAAGTRKALRDSKTKPIVILYKGADFTGEKLNMTGWVGDHDLDSHGFGNNVSSIVVKNATVTLYKGEIRNSNSLKLGPGKYNLRNFKENSSNDNTEYPDSQCSKSLSGRSCMGCWCDTATTMTIEALKK